MGNFGAIVSQYYDIFQTCQDDNHISEISQKNPLLDQMENFGTFMYQNCESFCLRIYSKNIFQTLQYDKNHASEIPNKNSFGPNG